LGAGGSSWARAAASPVGFAQGDAVEGDLRVVLGGLKFARRFLQRRTAALWFVERLTDGVGIWLKHLRSSLPV